MPLQNPTKTFNFEKWQGAGNDFILIDHPAFNPSWTQQLCHRRYGIGADGVIWFLPPADMRIFNADGTEAACCGNALRCLAAARNLSCINNKHHIKHHKKGLAVSMGVPKFITSQTLDTGVPHHVVFDGHFQDAKSLRLEHNANVNFAKMIAPGRIAIRTYERGVEDETYSCGTGAVAVCAYAREHLQDPGPFTLEYISGDTLFVFFQEKEAWLVGDAKQTFRGEINANWDTERDQRSRISSGSYSAVRSDVNAGWSSSSS
ncbi:MAG TPA: hypothetical protein PLO43_01015 [Chlamydiales bacterium]|nr:hypothetical protein [Chlamydiales bacterium]HPE84746.1 hypothetical protein [Chlamydiales bacterium]